ncbi:MAG: acyl-CoA dehydrogenase family protein [Deltaproteobacteria bacterium]|nr:acyl-CoA dehydrogenase family protein [Deltaproteobacteria bacterium]
MPIQDIDLGLTDEERAIRDVTHKFAEEVIRPAGVELDRLADPSDVIARDSVLWKVFERYRELDLEMIEAGDGEADPIVAARIRYLVNEELGWGDSGLAVSLGVAGFPVMFAKLSGRPELIERFASPERKEIGCWAVTEPNHGSDSLAFDMPQFEDASIRPDCIATPDGDEFVIRGQKAAWVSNGTIATVATLFCTIDPSQGFKGGGVALVPLDLPGVSRGKPLDKLGQRALNQGEIFFDDVRIPAEYMVVGTDAYSAIVEMVLATANAAMGTIFVGVARAALEHALDYSRERIQGGVAIFEHQNVKSKIFRMFSQVEAARSLARRVMLYNSTQPPLIHYSIASKTFCTQTAFDVASDALQIYGGNGLSREYPIEKLLRDARASMIEDGCNDILGLVGAGRL